MSKNIPFTKPVFKEPELSAVMEVLQNPEVLVGQVYQGKARDQLTKLYDTLVLPTHSCTAALEMAAILLDIKPGDEIIMPTYTFVSTANAFVLRGAKLRYVDCNQMMNVDASNIESAITGKTKAIVVMHYAGVACDMDAIMALSKEYAIPVVEDAAQCIGATYKGKKLGSIGQLGCLSFHATKNITAGSGGALIINDEQYADRAKVLWQRGTNREAFLEGVIDKYTWQDLGSSFTMGDLDAALLCGQLARLEEITQARLTIWQQYCEAATVLEEKGFKLMQVPDYCEHNAHIFYVFAPSAQIAKEFRVKLKEQNVVAMAHYVPLHLAPAGKQFGVNVDDAFPIAEDLYGRLVRLPLWEEVDIASVLSLF